nr:MAG TPA: hypothetical protein [Caudoviricetes sp.]
MSDSNSAQQGQAPCPCWVSTLPQLGKHAAQKAITVFLYELECSVEMTMQTFALFFHAFFTFRIIYIFNKFLTLPTLKSQ